MQPYTIAERPQIVEFYYENTYNFRFSFIIVTNNV